MMRGSSGGDFEVTGIPVTRSMIFWEASEVCKWLDHLQFDQQVKGCLVEERCVCVCRLCVCA